MKRKKKTPNFPKGQNQIPKITRRRFLGFHLHLLLLSIRQRFVYRILVTFFRHLLRSLPLQSENLKVVKKVEK